MRFRPKWRKPNPFVSCVGCGCVYQNPQPVRDDLVKRYDEEYLQYELDNESNFFRLMKLGLKDIRFDRIEARIGSGGRFLDVGCATGMLLEDMRKRGWNVQGVEVCAPAAEWGTSHRGIEIFPGPIEAFEAEAASFDVVHCSHLIEHLTDPKAYIRKVHSLLKRGGRFIVTTPNIDGLQAKLFGYGWRSAIDDHMVLFSKRTLMKALKNEGFRISSTRTWGGLAAGAGFGLIKPLADKAAKLFGFGDVVIAVAEKT